MNPRGTTRAFGGFRPGLLAAVCALTFAVAPALASAADYYVDAETGSDAGPCSQAAPCKTIAAAAALAGGGDRVLLDSGSYAEQVTLAGGAGLEHLDFVTADGSARPVIDGGAGTGLTVTGAGSYVRGITARGDTLGIALQASAELDDIVFDDPDAVNAVGAKVFATAAGSWIHDSSFSDPAPSPTRGRLGAELRAPSTLASSDFSGFNVAIQAGAPSGADTVIEGNTITATHNMPAAGRAIIAEGSSPSGLLIVRENTITAPAGVPVNGIEPGDGVRLVRNLISGHYSAVRLNADVTGVEIIGDRYYDNELSGIDLFDIGGTPPQTSATATNITSVGNGGDIRLYGSSLTLDSSIVEGVVADPGSSCTITYSIGPADPGGDTTGCFGFASTADPLLADPAAGDLHLLAGSPAIDAGNPAAPGAGEVDFDGDPRALTGNCPGPAIRDIGADEYSTDCDPPETTITTGPAQGAFINDPTPVFGFESNEPGSSFECSIDGGLFGPCSHTGQHILDLTTASDGAHSFTVRATDAALNTDPTPATRNFTLDRIAPETAITAKPKKRTIKRRVSFRFSAGEVSTFSCRLDAKAARPCVAKVTYTVKPGRHTFTVTATDRAGNPDPTPAQFRFRRIRH